MSLQSWEGHQRPGPNVTRNAISQARNGPTIAREAGGRLAGAPQHLRSSAGNKSHPCVYNTFWLLRFGVSVECGPVPLICHSDAERGGGICSVTTGVLNLGVGLIQVELCTSINFLVPLPILRFGLPCIAAM